MKPSTNLETALQTKRAEVEFLERTLREAAEKGLSHLFKGQKVSMPATKKNTVRRSRGRFAYDRATFQVIRQEIVNFLDTPNSIKAVRKQLKKLGYNLKTQSVTNLLWMLTHRAGLLKKTSEGYVRK